MNGRLGLAFTAGMLATVNPCGFAMLPAYLAWFLGVEGDRTERAGVVRAIGVGAVVSVGFMVVFGAIGSVLSWAGVEAARISPWITIPIGVVLVGFGIAMLRGYEPQLSLPKLNRGGRQRTLGSMFLFGMSYAIASVSCTAPVFLSQVSSGFGQGFATGMAVYLLYGLGMATVLIALSVAIAQARHSLVGRVKELLRYVNRAAGVLLIVTGAYIAYYGWYEVSDRRMTDDPLVDRVTGWSSDIATLVSSVGAFTVASIMVLVVALIVLLRMLRADEPHGEASPSEPDHSTGEASASEPDHSTGEASPSEPDHRTASRRR